MVMESILQFLYTFLRSSYDTATLFAFVVSLLLLLAGLDDFFLDIYYWVYHLFAPGKMHHYANEPVHRLMEKKEKPIAIFIPAWHEFGVIAQMLTHTCRTLRYMNYEIFVGVYPNDARTRNKVEAVAERYPKVHVVVAKHPGPSTKAENLNEIHEGMLRWENLTGIRFDIIVMHDAEDVVHPLSLKIHNYCIPDYDMVQLPVFPLPVPHTQIVHWTYADEFAEHHTKDLVARQLFTGFIPSAGVGTGYNRWLIEFVGTSFARNMFRKASLTEDYDIALRLALGKAKLLFLYRPFGLNVGTRAFFPETFHTAVRQKTRWLIGICLQSWQNIGWFGDLKFRLTLYRDRKAVVTNVINAFAYMVLAYVLLYELGRRVLTAYGDLPPIINPGTLLYAIVVVDTCLMLWRFIHRFLTVNRIYGWWAGLLSILRLPLGNVINLVATVRSIGQFTLSVRNKSKLRWDKTAHTFPSADHAVRNPSKELHAA